MVGFLRKRRMAGFDRSAFRPIEALESRTLCSATVQLDPWGNLSVQGDSKADNVAITVIQGWNGTELTVQQGSNSTKFYGVQSIYVDTGAGKDKVTFTQSGPGPMPGVYINAGDGDDVVNVNLYGSDRQNYIYVDTGAGKDSVVYTAKGSVQVTEWSMATTINLGAGDDNAVIESDVWLSVSGQAGRDNITVMASLFDSWLYVDGGAGNDTLKSYASAQLSGGEGDDRLEGVDKQCYFDGGAGANFVIGSNQSDTIVVSGNDSVRAGAGNDYVFLAANVATLDIDGGDGDDIFVRYFGTSATRVRLRSVTEVVYNVGGKG